MAKEPVKATTGDEDTAVEHPVVPARAEELTGDSVEQVQRAASQERAQAEINAEARERVRAEQERQEEIQRDTEIVADDPRWNAAEVEEGAAVKLRYLGTSDTLTIKGVGPDGSDVVAIAGGEPISVSREQADYMMKYLVHDRFEEVTDQPAEAEAADNGQEN